MNSSDPGPRPRVLPPGSAWRRVEIAPLPLAGDAGRRVGAVGRDDREGPTVPVAAHEAAIADAFGRGVAEGERRAVAAQAAREAALGRTQVEQWARQLAAFDAELEQLRIESADRVLLLATRLGASLACRQIALDPVAIVAIVDEALACLADDYRTLTIIAAPADVEVLRAQLGTHFAGRRITLRADASLARGSCHLLADDASLDARIETRLGHLLASLGLASDVCPFPMPVEPVPIESAAADSAPRDPVSHPATTADRTARADDAGNAG